jgi:hypothetical protein
MRVGVLDRVPPLVEIGDRHARQVDRGQPGGVEAEASVATGVPGWTWSQ